MTAITEAEFARIVAGLIEDRESIIKHHPIGTAEEVLLWMLLACLTSYLNLDDKEMPCFTGTPNNQTYRDAIAFVVSSKVDDKFDLDKYLGQFES